jgi:hypothetical protein
MNIRKPLIVSLLLITAMAAVSVWFWYGQPENAHIATQWRLNGDAKWFDDENHVAALLLPALALGIVLILSVIARLAPRLLNDAEIAQTYRGVWIFTISLLTFIHIAILLPALHGPAPSTIRNILGTSFDAIAAVVSVVFLAAFALQFLGPIWKSLRALLVHKHSLSIILSPHSPQGFVHHVIHCSFCNSTWDLTGGDYYGTSHLLVGEKLVPHLTDTERAQVFLRYARTQNQITDDQFNALTAVAESDPDSVLKMLGQ